MIARDRGWGLTQLQRGTAALAPASAPLDQRTPAQLMAMAQRYASLLQFYQLNGTASATDDWALFFASDISFLLADIAAATDAVNVADDEESALLEQIYAVASRINGWYLRMCAYQNTHLSQPITPLSETLNAVIIEQLGPELATLDTHPELAQAKAQIQENPAPPTLAAIWRQSPVIGPPPGLLTIASDFRTASEKINRLAHDYLQTSLLQSDHAPHTALYLAFLELFRHAQADLNKFTARHLEFYYRDVLKMQPQATQGDSVILTATLAKTCPSYTLPAGTKLSAGKDAAGNLIQYSTDSDVALNQAAIASLRSLFFGRGLLVQAPAPATAAGVPSVIYINTAPVADSQDGLGAPLLSAGQGWDTFGVPGENAGLNAEIGLLIASPVLLLQQGSRVITVDLSFSAGSTVPGLDMFSAFLSGSAGWQAVPPPVSPTPPTSHQQAGALQLVFALTPDAPAVVANAALAPTIDCAMPMLKLLLNPAGGAYTVLQQTLIDSITISVTVSGLSDLQLQNDGGAIASGKPFPPFGSTPLPGNAFQIAHPELAAKQLTAVTVDVTWLNLPLPDLMTGAPNGFPQYYDGYQPYLFPNSGFTAGISVCTGGVWQTQQTFEETTSQVAVVTAATAATATSTTGTIIFELFTDVDGTVQPDSAFEFNPAVPAPVLAVTSAIPATATSVPAADGTIQIALTAPSYGFGQMLFQKLFAVRAIENIKIIEAEINPPKPPSWWDQLWQWLFGGKKAATATSSATAATAASGPTPPPQIVMLNPPFTPMIKAISLGYSATANVPLPVPTAANGAPVSVTPQLWHIHPFGYALPPPNPTLFPIYGDDGYLFLGLSQIIPAQALSLHFQFREKPASAVHVGPDVQPSPAITWRYLSGNQWQDFPDGSINSQLNNFTGSGIVTLQIPADIDLGASGDGLMSGPANLAWIAVSVAAQPAAYCATVAILTQVASATRVTGSGAGIPPLPLPRASIAGLTTPVAAVKSISQPYPSQGGRPAETEHTYRVRVSERLKHKQRASHLRDYEQLVLEAFPGVFQVKCIGPVNSRGFEPEQQVRPGCVVLAVAPPPCEHPEAIPPFPTPVLSNIATSIQALASPFIRDICVRNISYDVLQVVADVQFIAGQNSVQCIKQLNQAICAALSPPASVIHLDIGCGEMSVSKIGGVIEAQSYVESLNSLWVIQSSQDGAYTPLTIEPGKVAYTRTPWSVLVSAVQHSISVGVPGPVPVLSFSVRPDTNVEIQTPAPAADATAQQYWLAIPADSLAEA